MAREPEMRTIKPGQKELLIGPFMIHLTKLNGGPADSGYGIDIWPNGHLDGDRLVYGGKVVNAGWVDQATVFIVSYHSGLWEEELLILLRQ